MKVLGIDFGGTQIRAAIIDGKASLIGEKSLPTLAENDSKQTIDRIIDLINTFQKDYDIKAIGIGSPGPLDKLARIVINPPNLPKWNFVPLADLIEKAVKLPVALDRDSNCALIGEHWAGNARGMRNIALITWGTGVGGALIANDRIYRGHSGLASEFGHMIIDPTGPDCHLGHSGCLESFIGGKAIEKRYGQSVENILEKARAGNAHSKEVVKQLSYHLELAIKNIVTVLDVESIILTGSVAKSADVLLPMLSKYPVNISPNASIAGLLGAGRIAIDLVESK